MWLNITQAIVDPADVGEVVPRSCRKTPAWSPSGQPEASFSCAWSN